MTLSNAELQRSDESVTQRRDGVSLPLRSDHLQPVILCGGSGTRLWPLSREQYPKQLLTLAGEHSMLQATACRVNASLTTPEWRVLSPIVVANEEYRFVTAEQLRRIDVRPAAIVLEPAGRNTAPALTLAALTAQKAGDDPVLVVMPADHVIGDSEAFSRAIAVGAVHAGAGKIVTFGIVPTRPEAGYGYIRAGAPMADGGGGREISAFVEKPEATVAARYVASGEYFWNSGIFMMRTSAWLSRIESVRPDIMGFCRSAFDARSSDGDFLRVGSGSFEACPADSIDYAVMEKMSVGLGVVIPLDAGWSDIGTWDACWEIGQKDADGNVLQGDVMALATENSLVISSSRLVALAGLHDVLVIETPDAVLVAHKNHVQKIKSLVEKMRSEKRPEVGAHRKVHRPWGYYDSVDSGSRFQVKRIVVKPGAALSLQMHHHRAEHWIVVRGTARVTRGDEVFLVTENESTFIPLGTRHRLENPGKVPLEMIEVQSGAYLGEDDIVRFEDSFGRS